MPPEPDAEIGNVIWFCGLEYAAQQFLDAAHEFGEPWIDMSHQRRGQRAVYARARGRKDRASASTLSADSIRPLG